MPYYQRQAEFTQKTHAAFDKTYTPGKKPPEPGIYRCINCGWEAACEKDRSLPPQDHHTHSTAKPIIWRLSAVPKHHASL